MIDVKQVYKAYLYDSTSTILVVWVLNQVCAANIRHIQQEIQQQKNQLREEGCKFYKTQP